MSGICGWVGDADPAILDAMLAAIDYRGDRTDKAVVEGAALGYRWWGERPGKSPAIYRDGPHLVACAGSFAPPSPFPAKALIDRLKPGPDGLDTLDGAFAAAWWDGEKKRLTLVRDPFGVRSLYYVEHDGVFYFASELKQLLAVPSLPVEADPAAIHKYLTFSFVPGEDVPVLGVRRLLPRRIARLENGRLDITPYFTLREEIDPQLEERKRAVRFIDKMCREAVARRLNGEREVGMYLSGGIDSSGVAVWLREAGVDVRAFSLDFGERSVEREQAVVVAERLNMPLEFVKVGGEDLEPIFMDLVWKLDLPFGDPVTGPQYLLGRAARAAGLSTIFNGEGGDQLFGGWTNKPMISAEIYADLYGEESREELYLKSYHRFYGLEEQLYTPEFREQTGSPGQRRAMLRPYLESERADTFLNRIRLADIALKGSQNILPRAERMANAWALDVRVPLFDRALAEASFRLPPKLKLHGAAEKYVLKLALQRHLPREIVWRRKFGMSVPITDWALGPLAPLMEDLLGSKSLTRRGMFRSEYVERLRQGQNEPSETRRRRVGERLWALAMLEAWMRAFIDGRGRRPGGATP
ncbi:MAG TPA: asparagine synthase-related protein [Blastocatellia bacterium]|nr:asparagine synthase-related protein [Blastocatellia bacterium]